MTPEVPESLGFSPDSASTPQVSAAEQLGPRIEPCQFEHLLQRAMEILNKRHLEAQLKAPRDIRP